MLLLRAPRRAWATNTAMCLLQCLGQDSLVPATAMCLLTFWSCRRRGLQWRKGVWRATGAREAFAG